MAVAVFFHAHPDDEAIATGGTMARAAAAGHRVVLVSATGGEHGEVADGFLGPGESLADRRREELLAAAAILGASRTEFLGYTDSGMMGTAENDAPGSFWLADLDEAAGRLAAILSEEGAEVLTVYDDHGNYGHPDHIKVHQVGVRAAEMAGTPRVYEATADRELLLSMVAQAQEPDPGDTPPVEVDLATLGTPSALITTRVDVRPHLGAKRRAMAAHASQISETSFFLAMDEARFEQIWGVECYVRRGAPPGTQETDIFDGPG